MFDNEGAFAIGVVELDPNDPNTVWVGTGENNSQRSVGYGDGVYRSLDGGKSWRNMGLEASGHISMIRVHPGDSDVVWVAAQGPLWNSGGDRGLYKTTDRGETWTRILGIDPDTGVNEFVIAPANPDVIVATSYQRRRHVWTLINGGPGSGVHKTTDGGKTWHRVTNGLPDGDLGRIDHLLKAVTDTPAATERQGAGLRALRSRIQDLRVQLNGDATVARRAEAVPLALLDRVAFIADGSWGSQAAVTPNHRASLRAASAQFPGLLAELQSIAADLAAIESDLEGAGAPWTPARIPEWPSGGL